MKVLFFSEAFWPHVGGIETFGMQLMTGLRERGVEFAVVTNTLKDQPDRDEWEGISVHRLPFRQGLAGNPPLLARALAGMHELKTQFGPDVVHLNTNGPSFYYHLMSASAHLAATLYTLHFFVEDMGTHSSLLAKMLEKCEWVNGVSHSNLAQARKHYPVIESKSSVIPNGLAQIAGKPAPLNVSAPQIFSWGRLEKYKGFDVVLRAFARISSRFPQSSLKIAGEGPEGEGLRALAQDLEISDRVEFLGYLSPQDLNRQINASFMVVVPSRAQECFGLVALEAMQWERPVLASRFGGLQEVVAHEETGYLFEVGNDAELAGAMEGLFTDPDKAMAWGQAGRLRAIEQFSLEGMCEGYLGLYQGVLKTKLE